MSALGALRLTRLVSVLRWRVYGQLHRLRAHRAWVRQGRPTTLPVVLKVGLLVQEDGHRFITDWDLDCRYMSERSIYIEDLWDRLSAQHPVVRL